MEVFDQNKVIAHFQLLNVCTTVLPDFHCCSSFRLQHIYIYIYISSFFPGMIVYFQAVNPYLCPIEHFIFGNFERLHLVSRGWGIRMYNNLSCAFIQIL